MSGTIWKDWKKMGEDELCINILEGTGTESSLAKNQRLEPKAEFIKDIGDDFNRMCSEILNNKECILQPMKDKRVEVYFPTPSEYAYKSTSLLWQEYSESTMAERKPKYEQFVRAQFYGDEYNMHVHMYAIKYAPLLLYKDGELMQAINTGAYDNFDIIRKDWAIEAFKEIFAKEKNYDKGIKELRKMAEALLIEWEVLPSEEEMEMMKQGPLGGPEEVGAEDPMAAQGGVAAPVEDDTPVSDAEMNDIIELYTKGVVGLETASNQLAEMTGKPVNEIMAILKNA
jgi:hypothetical protein